MSADRGLGRLVAIGVGVFIVGRLIDFAWHATHPEFETASDQIRAHAVVWLGALLLVVAAALAVARGIREPGYIVLLVAGIGYAGVAVWHFIEHANGRDPDLPHILLLVTNLAMFAGAGWTVVKAWTRRRSAA